MSEDQSAFLLEVSLITKALSSKVGINSLSTKVGIYSLSATLFRVLSMVLCSSHGSPQNGPPGDDSAPI